MGKLIIEGVDVQDGSMQGKPRSQFWTIVVTCLMTFIAALMLLGLGNIQAGVEKRVTLTAFEAEQRYNEANISMIRAEIKGVELEIKSMGKETQNKLDELLRLLYVHNIEDSKKKKVIK